MLIEKIQKSLNEVNAIIKRNEEEIDKSGVRFNIFDILGVSSNEVRLHSNFISELLNPKGRHGFKDEFLTLFIDYLMKEGIKPDALKIDTKNVKIRLEKSIGYINDSYNEGGLIDIEIFDTSGNSIIIENKIYARDQENQLLRYANYNKNALLLYLTITGKKPEARSTKDELTEGVDYFCISYNNFIMNWLKHCSRKSETNIKVNEILSQYIQIINNFTLPTNSNKMIEEVKNLIANNPEFYESIDVITKSYNDFRSSIKEVFFNTIKERVKVDSIYNFQDGKQLMYEINEDSDGFYISFFLVSNGEKIKNHDEDNLSQDLRINFKGKGIITKLKAGPPQIFWEYLKPFRRFLEQDKQTIFSLKDSATLIAFIEEHIYPQIESYRKRINAALKEN
ncbi:PD-(D/E)XK nuclease family protein [Parasediminibacterium sp. JCM 36343]|uniref:PDDEXK-like family protein n=1 Tax=Parasediminibacterium sp. JCM 36343 TaxID=3374279 RepID=UPI00397ABEA2